jgi:hypothetical protein
MTEAAQSLQTGVAREDSAAARTNRDRRTINNLRGCGGSRRSRNEPIGEGLQMRNVEVTCRAWLTANMG